jgi:hypothetical protein
LFRSYSGHLVLNLFTVPNHEYQNVTIQFHTFVFTTFLGSVLAISGMQGKAEGQAAVQPPEQAAQPQNPDETEEEKEKKKKKKEQRELEEQQRQQQELEERRRQQQTPEEQQQRQKQLQENERQKLLQEQQERELQQQRQQQQRQPQQKRVSQQEQQERIRKQEQQLALYRKNIALREELAERDAQILRQQKRIQHLRFQQEYEARLRAQRAQLMQARYDYYNDPYYYTAPNYRYRRGGHYYQTNQYGIRILEQALQAGYNEGYKAGRADREDRWRYDYRSAFAYRDANYGYDGRYIAQDEYNYYFREGFRRGYDDGYYGRQNYGRRNDDGGINDEWLIAGAVVAAIIGYELLTD